MPNNLHLVVDGKTIEIKTPKSRDFELNKALLDPEHFQQFVADPKSFAARYGLRIDSDFATVLQTRLFGITNLSHAQSMATVQAAAGGDGDGDGGGNLTLWAIAHGIYSIATTKIAVVA